MTAYLRAGVAGAALVVSRRAGLPAQTAIMLLVVFALASVWHAALGGRATLAGYDWRAFVWYVTFAELSTVPVRRIIDEAGEEIGSGDVSVAMLRPVSVVMLRISFEMGAALARQGACALAAGVLAWLLVGAPPAWSGLGLGIASAPVALAVNVSMQHALGGLAFWARDARATWFLFQKAVLLGGGVLMPLDLLPAGLFAVLRALPFAAIAYVPGELAAGRGDTLLLVFQACWLAVTLLAAVLVYARGQRRLEVLGG